MKEGQTQEPVGGIHELKIWPEYFDDVESGKKNFEVRKLDRLFGVGDILHLREWSLIKGYSGRETRKVITYVMAGGQWGLSEGNCILGIATPPPAPIKTEGEDEFIRDLKDLRNYFGEHDKSPQEHRLYAIADKLLKHFAPPSPVGIELVDIPKPIGDFIIDQKDIIGTMGNDGMYYHYSQVCILLNRLKASLPVTGESEAIGFAEWMGKGFEMIIDGSWECFSEEYCEKYNLQLDEHYTTSELLSTYKQSKK